MKPLTDEQKENMLNDIVKSISYISKPAPGEFTVREIHDILKDQGHKISLDMVRPRLRKLVNEEVLGVREIAQGGARTKVYVPLKDVSYEEILDVLLES